MTTNYNDFIKLIPELFDVDAILSKDFFDKIHNYVGIMSYNIYLLNSDSLNLIYPQKKTIEIPKELSEKLFKGLELNSDETKLLKKSNHELFTDYLKVKGAIYGVIVYEKETFLEDDITILNIITKLISTKVKDNELQKIIQTQLKTLTSALQATKETDKIKSEFIANTTHELRTPLNAILGFTDLLSNKLVGELNQKQAEYTDDIKVSALHLLGIINEILDISKIESNTVKLFKTSFELNTVIEEVVEILYPLSNKKYIKISKNLETDLMINADYQKLKQVLFNLLSNAIKFTENGGSVIIGTKANSNIIEISITDTGIGIKKGDCKKIFEKFTQLNDSSTKKETSTGLGLTISNEYVKLHEGTIEVTSEVGKGSTFTVKIPR